MTWRNDMDCDEAAAKRALQDMAKERARLERAESALVALAEKVQKEGYPAYDYIECDRQGAVEGGWEFSTMVAVWGYGSPDISVIHTGKGRAPFSVLGDEEYFDLTAHGALDALRAEIVAVQQEWALENANEEGEDR